MSDVVWPFVDRALSQRLEYAEAHANRCHADARARAMPAVGACWVRVNGASAVFDGVGSPLTQTFGLGMTEPPTAEGLEAIERFFFSRASDVFHEVSPLADPATLPLLTSRGYAPLELTTVLFRPVPHHAVPHPHGEGIDVRRIEPSERSLWAETAVRGWSDIPEAMEFLSSFGPIAAAAADAHPFLVWIDGAAVASGALAIHDGVALMAGASTVPLARGRGAQRALLAARLRYAAESGCTLAMVCAAPGTSSQRNAERSGFRIAYTRIKWVKRR